MSERENSPQYSAIPDVTNEALGSLLAERPLVEREGLPRGYRMRADSHYVDHLDARPAPPIRLISTRQLIGGIESAASLPRLVESISRHGVLQPLLVRRQNGHYRVIGGNKRLSAAIAAGVTDVPCLIFDVDDAAAETLAEADNLRAVAPTDSDPAVRDVSYIDVLRMVSEDLRAVDNSVSALTRAQGGGLPLRVTTDLIQAQAWRASWLTEAAAVLAQQSAGSRQTSIEVILDRVKSRFEAHARLTGLYLDCGVSRGGPSVPLDHELGTIAIAGCVFATLEWLENCSDARIEVRADCPNPRTLKIEIVQRLAPFDEEAAHILREGVLPRTRRVTVPLALLTARTVAARYGGSLEVVAIGACGSIIRMTFCKSTEN